MRLDHLLSKSESKVCFTVEFPKGNRKFLVVIRLWETPVPIPNTTVKTQSADDTRLETDRESRWPPRNLHCFGNEHMKRMNKIIRYRNGLVIIRMYLENFILKKIQFESMRLLKNNQDIQKNVRKRTVSVTLDVSSSTQN